MNGALVGLLLLSLLGLPSGVPGEPGRADRPALRADMPPPELARRVSELLRQVADATVVDRPAVVRAAAAELRALSHGWAALAPSERAERARALRRVRQQWTALHKGAVPATQKALRPITLALAALV